jgi:DeoR/GlpR family transcriptional regulator of sugar metabolism
VSGSTIDEAVSTLSAEYQVAPETLRADLNELVQQLNAAQLIDILD